MDDPRTAAARYRAAREERDAAGSPEAQGSPRGASSDTARAEPQRGSTAAERAAFVETAIQQAIRRGDFDDLPGAGKPLPGLDAGHDPDWWIRRKIQSEKLTGLGPPALMLRVESAELEERLDALAREDDVRAALDDFNRRVIEARRQLLGGPPVVTPTRDVDEEVAAWRSRRDERLSDAAAPPSDKPRRGRFRMRRASRSR
jgi:hypothetical protein